MGNTRVAVFSCSWELEYPGYPEYPGILVELFAQRLGKCLQSLFFLTSHWTSACHVSSRNTTISQWTLSILERLLYIMRSLMISWSQNEPNGKWKQTAHGKCTLIPFNSSWIMSARFKTNDIKIFHYKPFSKLFFGFLWLLLLVVAE